MGDTGARDLDRDVELGGEFTEAVRAEIDAALKEVHTNTPGIIQAFDKTTCRATVQPALKRIFIEQGAVELPQCLDVPVYFPRGGNFTQTWPVAKGDECLLAFSERAICNWLDRGGIQEPSEVRFHHYSDAFAYVGFSSKPNVVADIADDAMEIRTLDGSVVIRLEEGLVTLGSNDPTPLTGKRPFLIADLGNPSDPFTAWLTGVGAFCSAGPPPATGMTLFVKGK